MKQLVIYVHGKGGSEKEADHYRPLFVGSTVIGFDYQSQDPWHAEREFSDFFDQVAKGYDSVVLVANSIGAFFAMSALAEKKIAKAFFISPIVSMERLIVDMMNRSNITEEELRRKEEIVTGSGETLSWEYLCYVRAHPIKWRIPTCVLYGERDNLIFKETISDFAEQAGASLTIMKGGEHWFHTDSQMRFLDDWIRKNV